MQLIGIGKEETIFKYGNRTRFLKNLNDMYKNWFYNDKINLKIFLFKYISWIWKWKNEIKNVV